MLYNTRKHIRQKVYLGQVIISAIVKVLYNQMKRSSDIPIKYGKINNKNYKYNITLI